MARYINRRIVALLLVVSVIVFLNGFILWHRRSVRAGNVCFVESLGLQGKIAVALVFAEKQAENALDALKLWDTKAPCLRKGIGQHAVLFMYGDMDMSTASEDANAFRAYVAQSSNIKACFSEVAYLSANLTSADDIYDKKRTNHLWTRGPNLMFYNLLFEHIARMRVLDVQHLFWMEPDAVPVKSGWLDKLMTEATKGEYWIQGSSFRGKCLPNTEGACDAIGRDIIGHINGNALYNVGDLNYIKFMYEVANGQFMHWPFDLAPLMHMQRAWSELEYREKVHLYQRVDWIRNYGPYPVDFGGLPSSVWFVHYSKPLIEGEWNGNISVPEIDEWMTKVIKEENALAQRAVSLERRIAQLQVAEGARSLYSLLSVDNAEFSNATTPEDPILKSALEKAANSRQQVILTVVSSDWLDMLSNFVHHLKKAGVLRQLVVAAVDLESEKFARGLDGLGEVLAPSALGGTFEPTNPRGSVQKLRYGLIVRSLKQGYHVLSSDLDVVWQRNPFSYFYNELDLQVQSDSRTGFASGFEKEHSVGGGIQYSVARRRVATFWESVLEKMQQGITDADAMHELLTQSKGSLRWRVLEPALFPNGPLYFESALPQRLQVSPIALHNNWADSRTAAVYRFREAGMWSVDPPEHFKPAGRKFITFTGPLGDNGLNNQRMALRNALAFAKLLNRTLILPIFHREHLENTPVPYDFFFDFDNLATHFPGVLPHSYLAQAFPDWETLPAQFINNGPPSPTQEPWWSRAIERTTAYYHLGASQEELLKWYGGNQDTLLVYYNMVRRFNKFDDGRLQEQFHRTVFQGLTPNRVIVSAKDQIVQGIKAKAGTDEFNCLHLRRGDFFMSDHPDEKPISEVGDILLKHVPTNLPLYICTDVATEETRKAFLDKGFTNVFFIQDFLPSWMRSYVESPNGDYNMRYGQLDQLTCSLAKTFIGNIYSTFTWHIAYLREMYGYSQVCKDVYDRELGPGQFFI